MDNFQCPNCGASHEFRQTALHFIWECVRCDARFMIVSLPRYTGTESGLARAATRAAALAALQIAQQEVQANVYRKP